MDTSLSLTFNDQNTAVKTQTNTHTHKIHGGCDWRCNTQFSLALRCLFDQIHGIVFVVAVAVVTI